MKPVMILIACILSGTVYAAGENADTIIVQGDTSICAGNSLTLSLNFPAVTGNLIFPPGSDFEYSFSMPPSDWTIHMGGWSTGDAPFGNVTDGNPPEFDYYTLWQANVPDHPDGYDLYVRKEIDLTGFDLSNIHWYIGVDNAYALYLNGTPISSAYNDNYTYRWEYEGVFPPALLHPGNNIIAVALMDNGGLTAFDMMVQSLPLCPCPSVLWSTGETTTSIHITPAQTTKYFVTITDGATITKDSVTVTVNHNSMQVINTTICEGQSYAGHTVSGNYADSFVTNSGCDSIITLALTVLPKPRPNLNPVVTICDGDSLVLYPGQFNSYTWQDGSHQNKIIIKQPGFYSVLVTNSCGSATARVQAIVTECELTFPNAFTPNKDGKNDWFRILNAFHLKEYHLTVYSRRGQKIFETRDYNKGWDGSFGGRLLPSDVFVWYCEFTKSNSETRSSMSGTVTLIR
jgi:gliding motility-associated-like protein